MCYLECYYMARFLEEFRDVGIVSVMGYGSWGLGEGVFQFRRPTCLCLLLLLPLLTIFCLCSGCEGQGTVHHFNSPMLVTRLVPSISGCHPSIGF